MDSKVFTGLSELAIKELVLSLSSCSWKGEGRVEVVGYQYRLRTDWISSSFAGKDMWVKWTIN